MNLQNNKLESTKQTDQDWSREVNNLCTLVKYVSDVPIIMQTRLSKPGAIKFRSDLGVNQINLILKQEQSIVIPLLKTFSAEKIKLQHKILKNEKIRNDMYFSEHDFAIEIDEKGHPYCRFFHRIIPDVKGFDIFLEISKIQNYITQSNEENLKSKFAEKLLNYISSISKPLKHIRYFVEKILPAL